MGAIKKVDRRFFLKGAGSILIGLPMLPELLRIHSAKAADEAIPKRLLTMFYANGFPNRFATNDLSGPALAAMKPYQSQMVYLKGIDAGAAGNGGAHEEQCMSFARGIKMISDSQSGGPSLDYRASQALRNREQTTVDLLSAGLGGNLETPARYIMSWRNSTDSVRPKLDPVSLFEEIFGKVEGTGTSSADIKDASVRNSILDSVLESYKSIMAPQSGYTGETKQVISGHLDRVREIEKKIIDSENTLRQEIAALGYTDWAKQLNTSAWKMGLPEDPSKPRTRLYEDGGNYPKNVIYIIIREWSWVWPLMIEMMALALRSNYANFGSLINGAGGERYYAPDSLFPAGFPETTKSRDHHEYYHAISPGIEKFIGWYMERNAEVLRIFSSEDHRELNGKTLLENTPIFIGPEMDENHSTNNMTYFLCGGSNYFKPGLYNQNRGSTDVDVYNTVLKGLGVDVGGNSPDNKKFGNAQQFKSFLGFLKT